MSRIRSIPVEHWPVRMGGNWRHLYVVQEGHDGPIKIGIAANAFWRLSELQVGNHRSLHLRAVFVGDDKRDVYAIEQQVHRFLAEYRIGGEWFDYLPDEAIQVILQEAQ